MKMTGPLERVLRVFLDDPSAHHHGYDLMKAMELAGSTLYPMLAPLQEEGVLTFKWEPPQEDGRPPRKVYATTGDGVRIAASNSPGSLAAPRTTMGSPVPCWAVRAGDGPGQGAAPGRAPGAAGLPAPAGGHPRGPVQGVDR